MEKFLIALVGFVLGVSVAIGFTIATAPKTAIKPLPESQAKPESPDPPPADIGEKLTDVSQLLETGVFADWKRLSDLDRMRLCLQVTSNEGGRASDLYEYMNRERTNTQTLVANDYKLSKCFEYAFDELDRTIGIDRAMIIAPLENTFTVRFDEDEPHFSRVSFGDAWMELEGDQKRLNRVFVFCSKNPASFSDAARAVAIVGASLEIDPKELGEWLEIAASKATDKHVQMGFFGKNIVSLTELKAKDGGEGGAMFCFEKNTRGR